MTQKTRLEKNSYLEAIKQCVLVFDGAMGTSLQSMNLSASDYGGEAHLGCNDILVLTKPESVSKVHRSFLEAGADVIETNTFRSNRMTLAEFGLADKTLEINRAAARLARTEADVFSTQEKPRFVAGSIGPSGTLISSADPALSNISFEALAYVYQEQAQGLLQGGVDLLLIETASDILEVKAAVAGVQRAFDVEGFRVPLQTQVTLDIHGKMLMGTDIHAVLAVLEGLAVDVIGLNCSTGPEQMEQAVAYLAAHSQKPISIIPNAGLPINIDGEAVYTMPPKDFAENLLGFVARYGIRAIGGCCGTRPEHIRALVDGLANTSAKPLKPKPIPSLASSITSVAIEQEPKPFIVGERLNGAGSKAFKRLLLAGDDEGILQIAQDQIAFGAHALDLNVALAEGGDEAQNMARLAKKLSLEVPVPLVIDSVDPDVIEAGLQQSPGRCLINSVHFEEGDEKVRKVFNLARKYSAMVVCLTIDEKGLAISAERKLDIARRFLLIAQECGLSASDLLFDTLTFTLASGDPVYNQSASETLKGITLIKQNIPEAGHILGVSNISYGLSPNSRKVLNSVFLHQAIQAGLDVAIINPAQILPYQEIPDDILGLTDDLIQYKDDQVLGRFIAWFETHQASSSGQPGQTNPLEGLDPQSRLKKRIVSRIKPGLEEDIREMLADKGKQEASQAALDLLNDVLLPAMQEVGDAFGKGELILPFVLQSAEVMKQAVSVLEQYLDKGQDISKGKIVLATVFGDIHDIGKNLVKTILENNGYAVIDLGKQVPIETIIQRAIEEKADAIGLSALLVATSKQMQLMVEALHERQLDIPVVIGGAAINEAFGWRILQVRDGEWYAGGVFYCKDAFDGLAIMEALGDEDKRRTLLDGVQEDAKAAIKGKAQQSKDKTRHPRELIPLPTSIPKPPRWEPEYLRLSLSTVLPYLDKNSLYRVSWGAKGLRGQEWETLQKEYDQRLEQMLRDADVYGWLKPQALYGYWPCQAEEETLLLFKPDQENLNPIAKFHFPRSRGESPISLSDYFIELGKDEKDLVGLQIVTVGKAATEKYGRLEAQAAYSEGYFVHGLAVCMAEATAEYCSKLMREELGLRNDRGRRFSWGYPAAPDIRQHFTLFQLMPAAEKLGMELTSAGQMIPEQSTAAIFVHHQAVRYMN